MFAEFRALLRAPSETRAAREVYFGADKQLGRLFGQLAKAVDPHVRSDVLGLMAGLEMHIAAVYPVAFGPDPIPGEGGRDMSESARLSAQLFAALGEVEDQVARGRGSVGRGYRQDLGLEANAVLDRMATAPDLAGRLWLLRDLYDAVLPHVGGQAAESVAALMRDPQTRSR
jgi:hypothetical protein